MTDSTNEFMISEEIQAGVSEAFHIAVKWLKESGNLLFLYFDEDGKKSLSPIQGCSNQTQVLEKVRSWARKSNNVKWFVQMGCGTIAKGNNDIDALVAHCAERRQKQGFVLYQPLIRNSAGHLEAVGDIDFMSRIVNDFFSDGNDA